MNPLLTRNNVDLGEVLRCPSCLAGAVVSREQGVVCQSCNAIFRIKGVAPVMLDPAFSGELLQGLSTVNAWEMYDVVSVNHKVAKYSANKKSFWQRISPSHRVQVGPTYREFIDTHAIKGRILELGGGPNSMSLPGVVNIDINNYNTVDVIGDARRLPFKDNSFDAIISNSVLEHIWEVDVVANECHRIVKDGGLIFICVPQVCGRHHTIDYHRWTVPGLEKQFKGFEIVDKGVVLGPGMFVNHLVVNLVRAAVQNQFCKDLFSTLVEWLLFPLRFLDYLGRRSTEQENYAHTVYIIGKKAGSSAGPGVC